MTTERITGLVLAAGGSRRLGQPKQLLPYRGRTLLDHALDVARGCGFDQLICTVGDELPGVDFGGVEIVENPNRGDGCSSSIAAALAVVDPRSDVLVLLLGDQPGVREETVAALLAGRGGSRFAVCRYDDGRGHPFAFGRDAFAGLAGMHGDKAVWKLLDRYSDEVVDVPIEGPVPLDVDTWADYEVLRGTAARRAMGQ
jgi:molybdenum cofactor cytidylyltransferase